MRTGYLAVLALVTFACAIASCAESKTTTDVAEAGGPSPELDATSDAPSDAECLDADGGECETVLSCAEADFCAVPGAVDPRYALLDVWGSSDRDVWAVGAGGTVIHWDGATWTSASLPWKDTLRSVGGSGVSDVWIVSSLNRIFHSTGFGSVAGFTLQPLIDPRDPSNWKGATLTKVWSPGPGALFVGGPDKSLGQNDSLWRFRFGASADVPSWEPVSTYCKGRLPGDPCPGIASIWGTNDSDIWVVGERGMLRRSKGPVSDDGGDDQWTIVNSTFTIADLHDVWGSSTSDVWIVGDAGTLRHWSNDGSQRWEIIASPTTKNLRAVWGTGANDAWAVGDGGTILHWDGQRWRSVTTTLPPGPKPHLYGVWGSGPNDVWAVGEGVVLHFGGMKSPAPPIPDGGLR